MDIPRSGNREKKLLHKLRWPGLALLGAVCAGVVISLSNPSMPEADKRAIVLGTVSQGEMLRRVRGPGNLVARDVRWLTARTTGRVNRIYIEPGQEVGPDTLLLTLDNPEVMQQAREARLDLKAAEAEHKALLARLEDERLAQRSIVAEIEADLEHASFRYQAESALEATDAVSELDLNESRILVRQLTLRREMEQTRMKAMPRLHAAQVSGQRSATGNVARAAGAAPGTRGGPAHPRRHKRRGTGHASGAGPAARSRCGARPSCQPARSQGGAPNFRSDGA